MLLKETDYLQGDCLLGCDQSHSAAALEMELKQIHDRQFGGICCGLKQPSHVDMRLLAPLDRLERIPLHKARIVPTPIGMLSKAERTASI